MIGAAPADGFAVGWYGKIPGAGDFIARRVPASFSEPWDRWLQAAIEGSQERLGKGWRQFANDGVDEPRFRRTGERLCLLDRVMNDLRDASVVSVSGGFNQFEAGDEQNRAR